MTLKRSSYEFITLELIDDEYSVLETYNFTEFKQICS